MMDVLILVASLVAAAAAFGPSEPDIMTRHLLPDARCLDGSPGVYFYRASTNKSVTQWAIHLEGGGGCSSKKKCERRTKTRLGTSTLDKPTISSPNGFLSNNATSNPDFYQFNMVFVRYCTGDEHKGQRTMAPKEDYPKGTWGFYFSGHNNLKHIIADLKSSTAIASASHILVGGSSAGGCGVLANADFIAESFPNTVVKAAPTGGWFMAGNYPDQVAAGRPHAFPSFYQDFSVGRTTNYPFLEKLGAVNPQVLFQAYTGPPVASGSNDSACKAHYTNPSSKEADGDFICYSAHALYPFIKTPMFIMENRYDQNQINNVLHMPKPAKITTKEELSFVAYVGLGMLNSTHQVVASSKPNDGLFLSSCFTHTMGLGMPGTTVVGGKTSGQALADWFLDRVPAKTNYIDTCDQANGNLPCNPTCPQFLPGPPGH